MGMVAAMSEYDERKVRRFEPGTVQSMTIATLREFGFALEFSRALRSVRVVDRHGKSRKMSWSELEAFVDGLRVKAGREVLFGFSKRKRPRAKWVEHKKR